MLKIDKVYTGEYIVTKDDVDQMILLTDDELLELFNIVKNELLTLSYKEEMENAK